MTFDIKSGRQQFNVKMYITRIPYQDIKLNR